MIERVSGQVQRIPEVRHRGTQDGGFSGMLQAELAAQTDDLV